MEELLELVAEDAEALKCESEIARARAIITEGTSAHHQLKVYDDVLAAGGDKEGALKAVVDLLVEETTKDI
jgi:carboxylate-amine ligase